jgi:hypothetical protein
MRGSPSRPALRRASPHPDDFLSERERASDPPSPRSSSNAIVRPRSLAPCRFAVYTGPHPKTARYSLEF